MSGHGGSFGAAAARIAVAVVTVLVILPSVGSGAVRPRGDGARTPVVLFPAFHLTKLLVTVRNQTVAPECPR